MKKILLGSAVAVLLLSGCGEDEKNKTQQTSENTTKQETITNKEEIVKETTSQNIITNEVSKEVSNSSNNVIENIQEKKEEVKEISNNQPSENKIEENKQINTSISNENPEGNSQEVSAIEQGPNGELLYKSCASCHGQKAEKEALGKSQIIATWDKDRIVAALKGYKEGTYGGIMKNIMKTQIESKTDAEIDALATFISNL